MRIFGRVFGILLRIAFAFAILSAAALLALRAYHQCEITQALAIRAPNGVDEGMYIPAGGIQQWIQIRGEDRGNPVLLCLHGGPGGTWIPYTAIFRPWEKFFTLVFWDQRGAGKTLKTTGAGIASTMSVDRMSRDGIEVAEFVRRHLGKQKIDLLGFSWGSILGIHMAKMRPDLFAAYFGTGQVGDMMKSTAIVYREILEKARAANNPHVLSALQSIGPPPFHDMQQAAIYFQSVAAFESVPPRGGPEVGLLYPPPEFSLLDQWNAYRGFALVPQWPVYGEMFATNLETYATRFEIPIYFFQGDRDLRTVASAAREYFDRIEAPHKEMVLFPGAGHFAVFSENGKFLREMLPRI